jgi:hypothetical protein
MEILNKNGPENSNGPQMSGDKCLKIQNGRQMSGDKCLKIQTGIKRPVTNV